MPNPYEEPVTIKGLLTQTHLQRRFRVEHPGYITVTMKIPAESADDAYKAFNDWIGIEAIPFTMIIGEDNEQ
jgi:hypothetical protein